MFKTRSRISENISKRQKRQRKFLEVSASGSGIPLTSENWHQRWCTLLVDEESYFKDILEFEVKEDDVYLVTFPKSGTTWIQEATWLLMNNLDFDTANSVDLPARSPYIEFSSLYANLPRNTVELARNVASPRVLKSHLPAQLLPEQIWTRKSKVVYCARNPFDTTVSYFHFHHGLGTWQGNIDEFVEDLINNDINYSPYWDHVMDFWQMRRENNIFFTTYEEMKRDLRKVLIELNSFLGKPDLKEVDLKKLEEHLSFGNMKANRRTNLTFSIKSGHGSPLVRSDFEFMRRGIVGSFKDELSPETRDKVNNWTESNLAKFHVNLQDIFGEI